MRAFQVLKICTKHKDSFSLFFFFFFLERAGVQDEGTEYAGLQLRLGQQALQSGLLHLFISSVIQPQGGATNLSSLPWPPVAMVFHIVSERTRSFWRLTPDPCMQPICFPFTSLRLHLSSLCFQYSLFFPQNKQELSDCYFCVFLFVHQRDQVLNFWWRSR